MKHCKLSFLSEGYNLWKTGTSEEVAKESESEGVSAVLSDVAVNDRMK